MKINILFPSKLCKICEMNFFTHFFGSLESRVWIIDVNSVELFGSSEIPKKSYVSVYERDAMDYGGFSNHTSIFDPRRKLDYCLLE